MLKNILCYLLVPLALFWIVREPVSGIAGRSDPEPAVFWVLLAALGLVVLNWLVYALIHRGRPSPPVIAHGSLCVMAVALIEHAASENAPRAKETLFLIAFFLGLLVLILFVRWSEQSRWTAPKIAAMILRILIRAAFVVMGLLTLMGIFIGGEDIRNILLSVFALTALALFWFMPAILLRRRASEVTAGQIRKIVEEKSWDPEGGTAITHSAEVRYSVNGVRYNIRAKFSFFGSSFFGSVPYKAFVDKKIPVHYNPDNPAEAYTARISKRTICKQG